MKEERRFCGGTRLKAQQGLARPIDCCSDRATTKLTCNPPNYRNSAALLLCATLCHAPAIEIAPVHLIFHPTCKLLDSNKWANVQTSVGFGFLSQKRLILYRAIWCNSGCRIICTHSHQHPTVAMPRLTYSGHPSAYLPMAQLAASEEGRR